MTAPTPRDWLDVCAAVANEKDSKKLELLLQELIRALDDRHKSQTHARAPLVDPVPTRKGWVSP